MRAKSRQSGKSHNQLGWLEVESLLRLKKEMGVEMEVHDGFGEWSWRVLCCGLLVKFGVQCGHVGRVPQSVQLRAGSLGMG